MIFSSRKHRRPTKIDSPAQREQVAYILLEEARIRCERLRGGAASGTDRRGLHTLHREIGLAGFSVSAELAPARRTEGLALAHGRAAEVPPEERGELRVLSYLLDQAELAVEELVSAPGRTEHGHAAQVHLLQARELLTALRTSGEERRSGRRSTPMPH